MVVVPLGSLTPSFSSAACAFFVSSSFFSTFAGDIVAFFVVSAGAAFVAAFFVAAFFDAV